MTDTICINDPYELRKEDLAEVNGGASIVGMAVAVTACVVLYNACESAGESIGRAIYYATH